MLATHFDPLYVDVVIRRYEAPSGETAILVETGESFHELAARREREASTSGLWKANPARQNDAENH